MQPGLQPLVELEDFADCQLVGRVAVRESGQRHVVDDGPKVGSGLEEVPVVSWEKRLAQRIYHPQLAIPLRLFRGVGQRYFRRFTSRGWLLVMKSADTASSSV